VSFSGSNRHFSLWEYSGYEPYRVFYDHFIGDHNCIHVIVYSLERAEAECLDQVTYWLEFLRARIPPRDNEIFYKGKCSNAIKCLFIGTHADVDKTCSKNDEGKYTSDKANKIFAKICELYQHEFDLYNNHFVLDARAAWVTEIKNLVNALNYLKDLVCEYLPHSTMFLSRTLHNIEQLRRTSQQPIIGWKRFVDLIREKVNPLASDEHFREVIQQLQLQGEVVYLEGNLDEHLVCISPTWLCHTILGTLFCHERFNKKHLDGVYSDEDIHLIFADVATDMTQLKRILVALDLCCERSGALDFPALNLIIADDATRERPGQREPVVYYGVQIGCTSPVPTLMACMFPRLQVRLQSLTNYAPIDLNNNNNNGGSPIGQFDAIDLQKPVAVGIRFYDIDLRQWRYGSTLRRLNPSGIECLLSLDPDGRHIEIKASGPQSQREQLFSFVMDVHSFVEQTLMESLPGLNLEMHFISPSDSTITYAPKQVFQCYLEKQTCLRSSTDCIEKYLDVVCCGSEQVDKSLIYGKRKPHNCSGLI
jgi:death-associated protein kinase